MEGGNYRATECPLAQPILVSALPLIPNGVWGTPEGSQSCPCTPHLLPWASPHSSHLPQAELDLLLQGPWGRDAAPLSTQHPHTLLPEASCSIYVPVTRDRPPALGQHQEEEARRKKAGLGLFAVGAITHPQRLHQPCQAPRDMSGTSSGAGEGAGSSQRWQWGKSCEQR